MIFWTVVGILVKTLVPMPYVDVVVHNAWAALLGYSKKLYSEKLNTTAS